MDTYTWTPTAPYFVGSLTPMAVQFAPVFPTTPFSTFFPHTPVQDASPNAPAPPPTQAQASSAPPQLPRPVSQSRGLQPIQLANGSLQLGSVLNGVQFMVMLASSPEHNRFQTVNPASTMRSSYMPPTLSTTPLKDAFKPKSNKWSASSAGRAGSIGSVGSAGSFQSSVNTQVSQGSMATSMSSGGSCTNSISPPSPPASSPSCILPPLCSRVPLLDPAPGSTERPTPRKRPRPIVKEEDEDEEYVPVVSPSVAKVRKPGRPFKRRNLQAAAAAALRSKTAIASSIPGVDLEDVDMASEQAVLNACLGQSKLEDPIKFRDGWQCPECKNEYKHFKHARRHMLAHLGIKPHVCELCHSTFSRRDTMHRHYERCKRTIR